MTNEIINEQTILIPAGSEQNSQFYFFFDGISHGKKHSLIFFNQHENATEINYDFRVSEKFGDGYYAIEGQSGTVDSGAVSDFNIGILRDRLNVTIQPTGAVTNEFTVILRIREA